MADAQYATPPTNPFPNRFDPMKAHNIEVFARDGEVIVQQESDYSEDAVGDGVDTVTLTPEQAGAVCRWIMQAAREATLQTKASGDRAR